MWPGRCPTLSRHRDGIYGDFLLVCYRPLARCLQRRTCQRSNDAALIQRWDAWLAAANKQCEPRQAGSEPTSRPLTAEPPRTAAHVSCAHGAFHRAPGAPVYKH